MSDLEKHVEVLGKKAAEARIADEAMKFAQAALNMANAMLTLKTVGRDSNSA